MENNCLDRKNQKTFVSSNENVASTRIGCKPNLSKDVKLHFSGFFSCMIEHIYSSVLSQRYSKHIGQNRIET